MTKSSLYSRPKIRAPLALADLLVWYVSTKQQFVHTHDTSVMIHTAAVVAVLWDRCIQSKNNSDFLRNIYEHDDRAVVQQSTSSVSSRWKRIVQPLASVQYGRTPLPCPSERGCLVCAWCARCGNNRHFFRHFFADLDFQTQHRQALVLSRFLRPPPTPTPTPTATRQS